jgi:DNA-directed RNA polymerase subunit K/omega
METTVYTLYAFGKRYTAPSAFLSSQPVPARTLTKARKIPVVRRPAGSNPFEFAVVAGLRAAQLMRGSVPRVEREHKVISTAQQEVAQGLVARIPLVPIPDKEA